MKATLETVDWLGAQADAARERFKSKGRGWRRVLLWVVPGYGDKELRAWGVTVDLWCAALREMTDESRAAALDRITGKPRLRLLPPPPPRPARKLK